MVYEWAESKDWTGFFIWRVENPDNYGKKKPSYTRDFRNKS